MKKLFLTVISFIFLLPMQLKADEGMWFLMFIERLNHRDMQKMGLQLTAEEIYSINNHSLKDAIVQFDGGCTAEIISDQGLVLTNHHCGYDKIAELATPEDDILTNGFWAKDKSLERKPKSLSVRFFVRMDDVSKRILSVVNDKMTESERAQAIAQESKKIEDENSEGGKYVVSVRSFFQGNEYYYFVYQDYNDVRLVGTPPSSIGKFGGDTDNWEWPRHTGDFSMFRVYTDKNGNPAEYSQENIPMKPKHFLPVNISGIDKGDFSMILGYPGRTNRWMPAANVEQNIKFAYPAWVEASKLSMDVMKKYMDNSDAVRLNYAGDYAGIANYWKNRQGMIDALTAQKTVKTKEKEEKKFNKWANKKENKAVYGNVISDINAYFAKTNEKSRHDNYKRLLLRSSKLAIIPGSFGAAFEMFPSLDSTKKAEVKNRLKEAVNELFATYHAPLEEELLAKQLNLYVTKSVGYPIDSYLKSVGDKNRNDFSDIITQAAKTSIFSDKDRLLNFIDNPDLSILKNDELYKISSSLFAEEQTSDEIKSLTNNYLKSFRLLVDGLRKANPKKVYYPDANSTLRLTYGKVIDLPRANKVNDAKENWYTTLKGTVAKYQPNDAEFDMPERLIELYNNKDFGVYADKKGYMPVNFLTNHDITGGNSGSPVINGKGELIGLAFDGNIEAMAGDIIFDKKLQRTINVDIRYVLFIIDKFAGAKHIVDEMKIVK